MDRIKKNLQISSTLSIIIAFLFVLVLLASIFIAVFYDNFLEVLSNDLSESSLVAIKELGNVGLVLIYVLIAIVTVPFLIETITNTHNTNKLIRKYSEVSKACLIDIVKNGGIFTIFALSFLIGIIILYITLMKGYIVFLLVPILVFMPLYITSVTLKLLSIKRAFDIFNLNIRSQK